MSLGAVQTGQLAAANAKLEQQVGALEILTNTFIYFIWSPISIESAQRVCQ